MTESWPLPQKLSAVASKIEPQKLSASKIERLKN
jgi:hypothetical protein